MKYCKPFFTNLDIEQLPDTLIRCATLIKKENLCPSISLEQGLKRISDGSESRIRSKNIGLDRMSISKISKFSDWIGSWNSYFLKKLHQIRFRISYFTTQTGSDGISDFHMLSKLESDRISDFHFSKISDRILGKNFLQIKDLIGIQVARFQICYQIRSVWIKSSF